MVLLCFHIMLLMPLGVRLRNIYMKKFSAAFISSLSEDLAHFFGHSSIKVHVINFS